MPPEAKVAIIEDEPSTMLIHKARLVKAGHRVLATASTMEQARAIIPQFDNLGIQVVTLDGNLSSGQRHGMDGETLAREIHAQSKALVLGISGDENGVRGADINISKDALEQRTVDLGKAITDL